MRFFCLLIFTAAIIFGASSAAAFECVPGRYAGKSWSVNEAMHGKDVFAVVVQGKDRCELRFSSAGLGADEIWELSGNKLVQRELDSSGKEKLVYGATLEVRGGVEGYYVDCRPEGSCDGETDPRNFWRIENKGKGIVYSYWGVDPAKSVDSKASPRKRLEYTFSPSK